MSLSYSRLDLAIAFWRDDDCLSRLRERQNDTLVRIIALTGNHCLRFGKRQKNISPTQELSNLGVVLEVSALSVYP